MDTRDKKVQKLIGFSTNEKVGIVALLVLIVAAPFLFTQIDTGIHFTGRGEIGDVIGGITAPFVNLLAAYLVYKSFTAQIRANAQQRDDHDEQMAAINNEQSINYLLSLYEKMEQDYYNNEESINNVGRAEKLRNGFEWLDASRDMPDDRVEFGDDISISKHRAHKLKGESLLDESIAKVNYIYHNFAMLTDALFDSVTNSSNKNLRYIVRYIAAKVFNLMKSNDYTYLVEKDIEAYLKDELIDERMYKELRSGKRGVIQIMASLDLIMNNTSVQYSNRTESKIKKS